MDDRLYAIQIAAEVLRSKSESDIDNLIPLAQEILEFLEDEEVK